MKVALVHDWITGYRGGERVLEVLCEFFPNAPLYTLVYIPGTATPKIENRPIHASFIQHLPFSARHYRSYLPLFPLAAESMRLKGYDLVVSTSHAVAKSIHTGGAPHWCYIHTPMRYIWDRFDDYFGADQVGRFASNLFFSPIAAGLRKYDRATAHRVDYFAANSHFVAERVEHFYRRKAEVIYGPVDVQRFYKLERKPEDFYLFYSALVPYKKADHAILACQKLGRKLVVLYGGPGLKSAKKIADPKWTEFVEARTPEIVNDMFSRARALLFPGIEDFGIVPVEAMAAGLPVIALKAGGVLDTLTKETAVFYDEQTPQALATAIQEFEQNPTRFDLKIQRHQAEKFSIDRFRSRTAHSLQTFLGNF